MENKRFYWLKLKEDFFEEKQIKYLRALPDGDKLVIAYLKMQLKSLKTEGFIKYDSILPSNIEELAMVLDEDKNIVSLMIKALLQTKAVEVLDDGSFYMIAMQNLIGKESESAERVRQFRVREKQKMLQCNADVTKCNIEIDIDKDIDIYKEIDNNKLLSTKKVTSKTFVKPTLEEVQQYCYERNNNVDAQMFIDFYESKGWKVGNSPMKDWKASVRTWEKNRGSKQTLSARELRDLEFKELEEKYKDEN